MALLPECRGRWRLRGHFLRSLQPNELFADGPEPGGQVRVVSNFSGSAFAAAQVEAPGNSSKFRRGCGINGGSRTLFRGNKQKRNALYESRKEPGQPAHFVSETGARRAWAYAVGCCLGAPQAACQFIGDHDVRKFRAAVGVKESVAPSALQIVEVQRSPVIFRGHRHDAALRRVEKQVQEKVCEKEGRTV